MHKKKADCNKISVAFLRILAIAVSLSCDLYLRSVKMLMTMEAMANRGINQNKIGTTISDLSQPALVMSSIIMVKVGLTKLLIKAMLSKRSMYLYENKTMGLL